MYEHHMYLHICIDLYFVADIYSEVALWVQSVFRPLVAICSQESVNQEPCVTALVSTDIAGWQRFDTEYTSAQIPYGMLLVRILNYFTISCSCMCLCAFVFNCNYLD
jgi:hypothetical protein